MLAITLAYQGKRDEAISLSGGVLEVASRSEMNADVLDVARNVMEAMRVARAIGETP